MTSSGRFCRQILDKDYFIIFAKIADYLGHIIASAYTPGFIELMSPEETERVLHCKELFRLATRDKFKSKIGDLLFSISRYSKEVRTTIPIQDSNRKSRFLLLLTFYQDAEADSIILKKILPFIADNKEYFL